MCRLVALVVALIALVAALPAGAAAPASSKGRSAAAVKAERIRAYEEARADLGELGKDAKRRNFRHHWLALAKRFDAMADRKDHPRRCEALFLGGRLYGELAAISYHAADRREAVDRYRRLGRACPSSNLADDGLFRAAELLARDDRAAAQFELDRLFRLHPTGDMVREARELAVRLKTEERQRSRPPVEVAKAAPVETPKPTVSARPPEPVKSQELAKSQEPVKSSESAKSQEPAKQKELAKAQEPAKPPEPVKDEVPAKTAGAAEPPVLDGARLERLAALERATQEISLSAVAGLKVRRVVIDPGHGGRDTGAIGKNGTRESEITLAIAKKLRRRLEAMGLEVLLTRDTDKTVSLEARTAFANERRADLFVSIHCNAARSRQLRGVETYTLNLNSDNYATRLAARENADSERTIGDLQLILADLATKANTDDSVRLATAVQGGTVSRLGKKWDGVKDLGTKQALFFVLLGAKMPAILFEASFLSHPEEEKRLRSDAYQEELAAGIADGVRRFVSDREAIARAPGALE